MDLITILVLAAVVLIVAALILLRIFKKPTMEEHRLHYGERLLFDDDNCTVEAQLQSGTDKMENVFVRVTNMRILLSQRGMGRSSRHQLRYIIRYEEMPSVKKTHGEGVSFVVLQSEPKRLAIDADGMFRIEPLPGHELNVPSWLRVKSENIDTYRQLFRI
jgi:hypothetical protein